MSFTTLLILPLLSLQVLCTIAINGRTVLSKSPPMSHVFCTPTNRTQDRFEWVNECLSKLFIVIDITV